MSPHRLGVLVGGTGRHLDHLATRVAAGELDVDITLCISHKRGVQALEHAARHGIEARVIDPDRKLSPVALSEQVFEALREAQVETAILAGFLRFLPIPDEWIGRVLNIHPSLLPAFGGKGFYGSKVHQAVLDRGCQITGCTVHYVDNQFDAGPILLQRAVEVQQGDDVQTLADRVFELERHAYPDAIRLHLARQRAGS